MQRFVLFICCLSLIYSQGNFVYISNLGIDFFNCGQSSNPCATINRALNAGIPQLNGIIVRSGVYTGFNNIGYYFDSSPYTINFTTITSDTGIPSDVTFDAQGSQFIFQFDSSNQYNLSGITFKGAVDFAVTFEENSTSPSTINNCVFTQTMLH
jgi:hypothetical protein